jgi:hypothetical protein
VLIANLIASLWNVDPYHEGAIFPTAAGLAQGLNVFHGVSQQYGFLLPLVISPFLKVFGTYLFVSRLASFVLLILLAFLMYKVSCIYMNRKVASYASLLWLSVSPIWSYTMFGRSLSGGVWPNHLAMILVLISILLIHTSRAQTRLISVSSVKITHNCKIEVKTVKVDFRSKAGVKTHQDKVMWYYGEQNIKANLNQA